MEKSCGVLFIWLFIIVFTSCEKDDICVEGNTPLLVIEFFDVANPTTPKNVPGLRIVGLGQNTPVGTFADRTALSLVTLPLRTTDNTTAFLVINNSATSETGAETGNVDTLLLTYDRIEDFASRACGFIVNYDLLSSEIQSGSGNWIQETEVIRASVINSDSTHVKIFH
jgi:hypothetical protein